MSKFGGPRHLRGLPAFNSIYSNSLLGHIDHCSCCNVMHAITKDLYNVDMKLVFFKCMVMNNEYSFHKIVRNRYIEYMRKWQMNEIRMYSLYT